MGNNPSGPEDASTLATPLSTTFTAQWATIQPHNQVDPNHNVPLAREGHCAVVNEGTLIVCCGAIQNNDKSIGQSNAVYSFDLGNCCLLFIQYSYYFLALLYAILGIILQILSCRVSNSNRRQTSMGQGRSAHRLLLTRYAQWCSIRTSRSQALCVEWHERGRLAQ
jgi:hypothetical protein